MRCGESEFRFIERSGLYFGLLLGFIQAALVPYSPRPYSPRPSSPWLSSPRLY